MQLVDGFYRVDSPSSHQPQPVNIEHKENTEAIISTVDVTASNKPAERRQQRCQSSARLLQILFRLVHQGCLNVLRNKNLGSVSFSICEKLQRSECEQRRHKLNLNCRIIKQMKHKALVPRALNETV